ncbi:ATP-binding protein [Hephaestia sp. GCM10023244]|uniref:sensor histidine kinase n=1 Tax=unclassified Hephaestia TaxID=2631281 RepID=UPI002076FA7A|nr:HAMP domain-containing sensor histidine kinase [Hephaestia sp. MAHUQ-44]MCM8732529.1 HAMP domain-containing histidine kinase [Hephaestia sp. MAHUQ-44]
MRVLLADDDTETAGFVARGLGKLGYALFGRDGQRVAGALRTRGPGPGLGTIPSIDPREGPDVVRALTTDLPHGYRLVVAQDTEDIERFDHTILSLFGVAFGLIVLLGVGAALLLGGYLRRRLERLGAPVRAIVGGDLDSRMPVSDGHDEFDQLALALNAMLDRIAQLLENLRQVSSDVAHDLRTPLAQLRGQLEAALDVPRDSAAYRIGLKRAIVQSDDLLALSAAILRISEVEDGAVKRTFARIDINDLVTDLCDSFAPAVADGGRTLTCDAAPGLALSGDRELLAQALVNLLDNAQHHIPPGARITIAAAGDAATVRLTVADNGPGVAPEDRERITRRFVRLDSSRATPGHGLGLNLVVAVAQTHGGTVAIDDNQQGLRVTMTLPRLTE